MIRLRTAYQRFFKNKILFMSLLLMIMVGWGTATVFASQDTQNVLLINSYQAGFEWTEKQTDAIKSDIIQDDQTVVHIEYMDWKRYPSVINLQHLENYYRYKYAAQKIDLIMTTDDAALEFAIKHRQEIFANAPIVFSGVIESAAKRILEEQNNITGVYEKIDPYGTINLAKALNPLLSHVYVLYDQSESGRASGDIIKEEAQNFNELLAEPDKLKIHDLSDLRFEEVIQKIADLSDDSMILIGSYSIDQGGLAKHPENYSRLISAQSNVPVYSVYGVLLGNGIVGGSILSPDLLGKQAANLGKRILQGEPVTNLAIENPKGIVTMLDYNQLERFKMENKEFPKDSQVINQPFSFTQTYRFLIYRISFVLLLLFVLILLLLNNIRKRKKAEKDLSKQNEELTALYEELMATEEELRQQFSELAKHQEILKEQQLLHQLVLEASKDSIWDWDLTNDKRVYSGKVFDMLGYHEDELEKYEQWQDIVHPADLQKSEEKLKEHLTHKTETYFNEYRIIGKDGKERWIRSNGKALFDEEGHPYRMVGSHRDITELKEHQERIHYLAYYDYLTGLPNRALLKHKMEEAIIEAKADLKKMAILYLDLDNFKVVNDSFGHRVGDQLLIMISKRLTESLGEETFIAKLGGDEFILLFREVEDKDYIINLAERIVTMFDRAVSIDSHACHVSASVGIVFYPEDGDDQEELLKNADTAMYKAKELGKRRYIIFNQEMNEVVVEKANLQVNLRKAIDNQEFVLHYQPQVDLQQGTITGFEALIRWYGKEDMMIQPDRFIGIAEETGLIIPIGKWVLESACAFAMRLHALGYPDLSIAVNISTVQLRQADFVEMVMSILEMTGLSPEKLELEITETVLIEFFDPHINAILTLLKSKGVKVSLDDFGRGYSSLNYIRQLPINTLKIDKSFIDDIQGKYDNKNLTGSIIILAHQLGLKVIAEGVEIVGQLEYLRNYRCDAIQGYIISKAIPETQVLKMLSDLDPRLKVY